ncbi:hypothetical protein V8G21_005105 [Salmonella enterica]
MNTGDVQTPDNPLQNSVVTTEGVVHIYRVVKKGLVTFETMNGQINLTLISF